MFRNRYASYDDLGEESELVPYHLKHYFHRGLELKLSNSGLISNFREVMNIAKSPTGKGSFSVEDEATGQQYKIIVQFWFDMGPGVLVNSIQGGTTRISFIETPNSSSRTALNAAAQAAEFIITGKLSFSTKYASVGKRAFEPEMDETIDEQAAHFYVRTLITTWRSFGLKMQNSGSYDLERWTVPVAFTHIKTGQVVLVSLKFQDETGYGDGQQVIVQVTTEDGVHLVTRRDLLTRNPGMNQNNIKLYNEQASRSAKEVLRQLSAF